MWKWFKHKEQNYTDFIRVIFLTEEWEVIKIKYYNMDKMQDDKEIFSDKERFGAETIIEKVVQIGGW